MPLTLFLNWRYALLLIGLCAIFAILIAFVLHKSEKLQSTVESYYTDMAERTTDTLGNIALVQSFARVEDRSVGDEEGRRDAARRADAGAVVVGGRGRADPRVHHADDAGDPDRRHLPLYRRATTTVGEIVMFMSFATHADRQARTGGAFRQPAGDGCAAAHRILRGARHRAGRARPARRDRSRPLRGLVEFKDVSFSYDGKRPAVADLTFTALPGETVALVGATGAGKSTALALLHRAFDPQSGVVKIDGMDIRGLTLSGLRHNIGVVFQEALLFNRSIADNLRVGKPDATEEEMREACARAQALDLIERTSGRLRRHRRRTRPAALRRRASAALASRAHCSKNPPILILDEATSALDAITEAKVQAALDEVMKGRTTFVIAHRLATIRNATRILVFQNGRIIESGTFDELVRAGGHFAELAKSPSSWSPRRPESRRPRSSRTRSLRKPDPRSRYLRSAPGC